MTVREQLPTSSGVYQILNLKNAKFYVGSAVNFRQRWYKHTSELRRGVHVNKHLQASWNRYGADAFSFLILEPVEQPLLIEVEQTYIDKLTACDPAVGYNKALVAGSQLGLVHSAETRQKISDAVSGPKNPFFGKTHDPVSRAKIWGNRTVLTHSDETRAKMSKTRRGKNYGKSHLQAVKDKISQSRIAGGVACGEKNPNAKLTVLLAGAIRQDFKDGATRAALARKFNVTWSAIDNVIKNKTWRTDDGHQRF